MFDIGSDGTLKEWFDKFLIYIKIKKEDKNDKNREWIRKERI